MALQRKRRLLLGLGLVMTLGLVVGLPPAAATTETFVYTGAAQTWTVPAGVSEATFDLYGAGGGLIGAGGLGGRAMATIPVTPGDSIQVNVGGQGGAPSNTTPSTGGAGGFNGGGDGASHVGSGAGYGGGGASDTRIDGATLADRVLVAGGGGGPGGSSCFGASPSGGNGGGLSGQSGGVGCAGQVAGGGGAQTGPAERFGVGGDGGNLTTTFSDAGGGGGGGWYGGGGGVGGGGGGGSGHGPTGTVFPTTGLRSGNGLVTVTYTAAPTSKSQCKNNGWKAFPQFKNQGQCEKSVKV
jgi:hypothetical protein